MMMFHPGPGTRVTASIFESQIVGAFWVQKRYGTWPSKWSRTCSSIVVSWRNSRLGCKTTSPVVLLAFVSNSCLQSLRLDTFKWRCYFLPLYDFHLRHWESLGVTRSTPRTSLCHLVYSAAEVILGSKPIVICCPKPESAFHRHNSSLSTIVIDNQPLPCAQKIYIKTTYNFLKTSWEILWIIHQTSCQLFMSGAPNGQVGLLPGFI